MQQGSEAKSWNILAEFLRSSALDLFFLWKNTLLTSMAQNLEQQLVMNSVAETLRATPVSLNIFIFKIRVLLIHFFIPDVGRDFNSRRR